MISVIIPVLNEAHHLPATLAALEHTNVEIIVVDGGSSDTSQQIARATGCTVINSPAGRARQMNSGAAMAQGEILVFLHGDTVLPGGFVSSIEQTLAQPQVTAGAFSLDLHGCWWGLAMVSRWANIRSRLLQLPYGDQGIFLRQQTFNKIGGFADLPIMEDFCLARTLRSHGKIITLPHKVQSSGRHWEKRGLAASLVNQLIILGFFLGLSPNLLAKFYRGV